MAQAVINMKGLSHADVIKRANELEAGMTGNANFSAPLPTVTDYGKLITTGVAKMTASKAADEAAKQATQDENDAIAAIILASNGWGDYVQSTSLGDPVKIASANMGVKAANTPIGKLGQVQNLSLTEGDNPGELDGHWDPIHGKSDYQIQTCIGDPGVEANWQLAASCGSSKVTLKGLASGTKVWVRVRAKAPKDENDGAWSQPAWKIVP